MPGNGQTAMKPKATQYFACPQCRNIEVTVLKSPKRRSKFGYSVPCKYKTLRGHHGILQQSLQ